MKTILSYSITLLVFTSFAFLFANTSFASDWEQFHYNAQRAGFNSNETQINTNNISDLELSWTKEIYPNGTTDLRTASPILVNNIVYLGSGVGVDRTFYALNSSDGSLIWSTPTLGDITSSAAYYNNNVYVNDNAFHVYAFNATTGNTIWQRGFAFDGNGRFNSPVIGNGTLFISQTNTSSGGILRALNPANGDIYWNHTFPFSPNLFSSPSFSEVDINGIITPVVYQCHSNSNGGFGFLDALDANTGDLIWGSQVNCRFSSAAISNNIVYIGSDGGILYALNAATGEIIWTSGSIISSSIDATPTIANNTVYVGGQSGFMYAFDAQTGALNWSTNIGPITSSAAIANGIIYVGTINNFGLYALDTNNGNVLWSYLTPKKITASPIIANGYVLVSADRADGIINGPLYAFHLGDLIAPTTTISQFPNKNSNDWNNTNVNILLNATDNEGGSGVREIRYSINGGVENMIPEDTVNFTVSTEGTSVINYWSVDNAGNTEQTNSYEIKINHTPLITLSPTKIWVGLKNSDDIGVKFDLKTETYVDEELVSSGELNSVNAGSSGFNNAKLNTINFDAFSPALFTPESTISIKLYVRNACSGSGHNSGTARLWYNDTAANSQFGATIGTNTDSYYLIPSGVLSTSVGTGPKKTIDVAAGTKCSVFKLFGTWSINP